MKRMKRYLPQTFQFSSPRALALIEVLAGASLWHCLQEEVDDLIGDEADEVANQQELQQVYRQVNQRADEDINPEELEKYIKERFERPAFAASGFNEQAGESLTHCLAAQIHCKKFRNADRSLE